MNTPLKYPIAIEPGDEVHAWGVVVPDLLGCFSAGDTLEEAIANAREAIELWIEMAKKDGTPIPEAKRLSEYQGNLTFEGWLWAEVVVAPD